MPRPAAPAALPARVLGLLGLICLVAVTLASPSATRMLTWPWAAITALLWVLPFLALLADVMLSQVWRLPNRMLLAGLFVLAISAAISAWTSPYSSLSLARVWPTLGGTAFYFWLHHRLSAPEAFPGERTAFFTRVLAIAGAILVVVSIKGWARDAVAASTWSVRNAIPFGHSNYVAGCMVLLLPWFALESVRARGVVRALATIVLALALLALVTTSSRGGVLALVAMLGAASMVALVASKWSRTRKILLVGAAIVAAGVVVFSNPRLRDLVLRRGWSDVSRASNLQRSAMFDAGVRLGRERPLLGWGPGTVPLAYPRVRASLEGGVDNVLQLHNTPVQIWTTLGSGGLLAVLLLLGGFFTAAFRAWRRDPASKETLAAGCSLLGYGVFALTDHQFDLPAIVALAASGLATLTASANDGRAWQIAAGSRLALMFASVALAAGPLGALGCDLLARRFFDHGLAAREAGHTAEFVIALERATDFTPGDPYFQHQIAGWFLERRDATRDPRERQQLALAAVRRLEASLTTKAHEEFAHFNLGWLQLELGRPTEAVRHFSVAAHLVPDKGGVYFGLGLALLDLNRRKDAIRAFALEWINDPHQLTSPAWEIPTLAALRPEIRAETLRLHGELRSAYPAAATAAAWTEWWLGDTVAPAELGRGFSVDAAAFAQALPAIEKISVDPNSSWGRCYAAWRARNFSALAADDAEFAAALSRRAARHPTDFSAFLRADTEGEVALVGTQHRQRTGYGVLALHPDGPVLSDIYFVQENRVATDLAGNLFPPKGWLPGRFLLALLPPDAR